jgi:hypothetical protein
MAGGISQSVMSDKGERFQDTGQLVLINRAAICDE